MAKPKKSKKRSAAAVNGAVAEDMAQEAVRGKPAADVGPRKDPGRKAKTIRKAGLNERVSGVARSISQYIREVRVELSKVVWPTRKETIASTSVVLVIVILIAIFLGVVDLGLSKLVKLVLS